jgi:hypothetical protein
MSNPVKMIRAQMRQVVKEILPEILASELQQNNAKELRESMQEQFGKITKDMMDYLKSIEDRQKDFQSYMIRQITPPTTSVEVAKDSLTIKQGE